MDKNEGAVVQVDFQRWIFDGEYNRQIQEEFLARAEQIGRDLAKQHEERVLRAIGGNR